VDEVAWLPGDAALALVSGVVVEVALLLGAVVVLALLLGEAALALVSGIVVDVALLLGAVVVADWLVLDISLELLEGVFEADEGGVLVPEAPVELELQWSEIIVTELTWKVLLSPVLGLLLEVVPVVLLLPAAAELIWPLIWTSCPT
jgi:hypothetical protein